MSHILIAHNEAGLSDLMTLHFADAGHVVVQASDGQGALAKLVSFQPDLILISDALPDIRAVALCTILRQLRATERVSIIVLGPCADVGQRQMLTAGCDDIIAPPFDCDDIGARVEAQLVIASHFRHSRRASLAAFATG